MRNLPTRVTEVGGVGYVLQVRLPVFGWYDKENISSRVNKLRASIIKHEQELLLDKKLLEVAEKDLNNKVATISQAYAQYLKNLSAVWRWVSKPFVPFVAPAALAKPKPAEDHSVKFEISIPASSTVKR